MSIVDEIRKRGLAAARLAEFEFSEGTYRAWNGVGTLTTADARTWLGVQSLGRISPVRDSVDLAANEVVIGLTRAAEGVEVDAEAFATAMNEERRRDVYGRAVRTYLQVFSTTDGSLVGDPEPEFIGIMSHVVTLRQGVDAIEIQIHCESLFAEGRKPAFGYYTDADQKARYPGDRGLEYIARNADLVLTWPRD